jgi:hypothetical protein
VTDLGEPLFGRHGLAVRACCYVAVGQHAGQHLRRGLELQGQGVGESAFFRFDDGAGVVGDQSAQQGVGVLGVAQVPGAVECMQARGGEVGRVADVVQPWAASSRPALAPRTGARLRARAATPWTCAQRRGRGSCRSVRASCPAQEASVFMRPRLDSCGGDVHGRGMPSEDVLFSAGSRHPAVVLATAGRTRRQEFCRVSAARPRSRRRSSAAA